MSILLISLGFWLKSDRPIILVIFQGLCFLYFSSKGLPKNSTRTQALISVRTVFLFYKAVGNISY